MEFVDVDEKDDVRYVPKHIIQELIVTYKAHPALWQVKNKKVYGNRTLKHKGYLALVKIWKKYDREANIRTVRNKVQSLRGSFRKELKKLQNSQKSASGIEGLYKPQLWYFSLMTFLMDHEQSKGIADNLDDQETHQDNENNDGTSDDEQNENTTAADISYGDKYVLENKKKRVEEVNRKISKACTDALGNNETENDAFGKFISKKLDKISNEEQIMYAESLITKVVNYAILNKLTEFSDITRNHSSLRDNNSGLNNYTSAAVCHTKMENPAANTNMSSTSACDWNEND